MESFNNKEQHMDRVTSRFDGDPGRFYVCQIPDPAKVEEWVAGLGDLDLKMPELHWCAMCCVRSLLLAEGMQAPPVDKLFAAACAFGVYRPDNRAGWLGAYHKELAKFVESLGLGRQGVSAHRGVRMRAATGDSCFDLEHLVRSGCYALLSVHPDIRLRSDVAPQKKRGHFVLVYGYESNNGQGHFLLNNPAGYKSHDSQVGMRVSPERLEQVSYGDCVIVRSHFSRLIGE
jgi:hypothetical protein